MNQFSALILRLVVIGTLAVPCLAEPSSREAVLQEMRTLSPVDTLTFLREKKIESAFLLGDDAPGELRKMAFDMFSVKLEEFTTTGRQDEFYGAHLIEYYEYFNRDASIPSLVLADSMKRCFLSYASEQMLSSTDRESIRHLQDQAAGMELSPQVFFGLRGEGSRLETDREATSTLLDASQAVWFSHGYTNRVDGYYGLSELYGRLDASFDLPSSSILENGDRVALGVRLLNTEQLRSVAYQGLAEFLSRGGKIDEISLSNVSTFYSVIPLDECMKFNFPPLAKKFLTPADVLVAAGRFPRTESERVWMKSVFR